MHRHVWYGMAGMVFTALCAFIAFGVKRSDFSLFIAMYSALFLLYLLMLYKADARLRLRWIALGIGLRVMLLWNLPGLSDDYARFIWDGRLSAAGIHPFAQPPSFYMSDAQAGTVPGLDAELYGRLNSPNYFTVYPPVCQAVFFIAVKLFPESIFGAVWCIKLFLLACELATIYLLWKGFNHTAWGSEKEGLARAALYALNPLVLLEITGNCHFEGAMICFLLAGLSALYQNRTGKAAALWALSVACKLIPLMWVPAVWRYLGWRKGWYFALVLGACTLLCFIPILPALPHMLQSVDLYFRQFQFNASLYYIVREIGYQRIGWDIGEFSGPALGAAGMAGILLLALFTSKVPRNWRFSLPSAMLFSLLLYLSTSATVQPWYIAPLFALSLLTPWRFALLWTGLAALSYSHYNGGGLSENYFLIGTEYVALWIFIIAEIVLRWSRKKPPPPSN